MYLLNHEGFTVWITPMEFTFHYVSIKSIVAYLFKKGGYLFTFHYVSIKSMEQITTGVTDLNLHSTMYLLNPNIIICLIISVMKFTFHYVSIKSVKL